MVLLLATGRSFGCGFPRMAVLHLRPESGQLSALGSYSVPIINPQDLSSHVVSATFWLISLGQVTLLSQPQPLISRSLWCIDTMRGCLGCYATPMLLFLTCASEGTLDHVTCSGAQLCSLFPCHLSLQCHPESPCHPACQAQYCLARPSA